MKPGLFSFACAFTLACVALVLPNATYAQRTAGKIQASNPNEYSDGTMSRAAAAAERGRLRLPSDIAQKKAANRARDAEINRSASRAAPAPGTGKAPLIFDHFPGLAGGPGNPVSPPDVALGVGPTRIIQLAGSQGRIFDRPSNNVLATGRLNQLFGVPSAANVFDPQLIWDATTNRFYYAGAAVISETDNRVAFGFSRNPNPDTFSNADWCHYDLPFGEFVVDNIRLGDSQKLIIIGLHSFDGLGAFLGSDLIAANKPPAGPGCPDPGIFNPAFAFDLHDDLENRVLCPIPANQIDNNALGRVIGSISPPSNRFWVFAAGLNDGTPFIISDPSPLPVPTYRMPPDAPQPDFNQDIDTGDACLTQAVQAFNPSRGSQSIWTQHTTRHPTDNRSTVRWYEINPAGANPTLERTGLLNRPGSVFNGAISPDRRRQGNTAQFGSNFVANYNFSGVNTPPGIGAASSLGPNGPLNHLIIMNGVGGYRDGTCPTGAKDCRWGDYAAMAPDPLPGSNGRGSVWGSNQYSGRQNPPATGANWRTQIFDIRP